MNIQSPIVQLIVLAIVGLIVSYIPAEPLLKRIGFIIIGVAIIVVLLRWLFPGIIL
jgi:hypothetical protein